MVHTAKNHRGLLRGDATDNGLAPAVGQVLEALIHALPESTGRICTIASARPGDGRTTLALNLARLAGTARSAALLVDADTRQPGVHELLGLTRGPGLSDVLEANAHIGDVLRAAPNLPALQVMTAGESRAARTGYGNSAALLQLFCELRKRFAWVFIDTAPLLAAPAAAALARHTDGAVLAVSSGRTRVHLVEQALALLNEAQTPVLGVVLTQRRFPIPSYVYRRL